MTKLDGKYVKRSFDLTNVNVNNEEKRNVITGTAVVYGSETRIGDWFREEIAPGALDNADMSDVALFLNHDTDKLPLARARKDRSNNSLELSITDKGLQFKTELDTERNADAAALVSAMERGDVSGMSFAFIADSEEWSDLDSELPKRKITGIRKLFEISVCTYPCYEASELDFARSAKSLESDKAALERAKERAAEKEAAEKQTIEMIKKKISML